MHFRSYPRRNSRRSPAVKTALAAIGLAVISHSHAALAAPPSGHMKAAQASRSTPPRPLQDIDSWYGVILDSQHLGYVHLSAKRMTSVSPARWDCVKEIFANQTPGNAATDTRKMERSILRESDGATLESWETSTEDGKTTTTHHIYTAKEIRSGKGLEDANSELPLDFVGPNSLKNLPKGWTVGKDEIITVDYKPISATRITATGQKKADMNGSYWIDRDRQLVRADVNLGGTEFRLERMSPASAVHLVTPLPQNQDVITPAKPLDAAREQRKRSYVLSNLSAPPTAGSDDVENIVSLKQPNGHYTAIITVAAAPLDEKSSPAIAAIDRTKFAAYLASGTLTPASDPAMIALARQIVGTETNAARAAKRLDQWIHTNLSYDWGFSGYRSAQQTLADRRGVCQNYATLLVTLARAEGIPAKYCNGPAYSSDGKFYRHAWVECWTGKWVALEPTWGQDFADASHVKLAEGEPDAPLDAWNSSAPPTIETLAPNADIAQVIRDHTSAPDSKAATTVVTSTTSTSVITTMTSTPMPDTAKDTELAKKIQDSAVLPPGEAIVLETTASYGPTVLMRLPWGSTVRIAQSKTVRGGAKNELLRGIRYILPDGRSCFVILPDRQGIEELEASLGTSFEYLPKGFSWTHAFVPYLKFDGDNTELARAILSSSAAAGSLTAINHLLYANPPASAAILPLLPQGTTASAMDVPDYRDAKGHLLTGISYHLPDGKTCIVMKVGDFD